MIRLIEPYIDEIIDVLEADLQARIAVLAAIAPAVTMKAIAKYSHGEKQNYQLPAIAVIPGRSPLVHDGQSDLLYRHRIVIGIHASHQDEETLTRLLERYAAAVVQTLMDRRAAQTITFPFQFSTEEGAELDWGAVRVAERSQFQRDVFFEVVATVAEERA